MKATGIVRRIDDLGRVVVPKEIRRTLRIREGDPMEIFTNKDGEIILKKYSPIGEIDGFAKQYADSMAQVSGHKIIISDRDQVIAVAGGAKKDLLGKNVSSSLENLMNGREKLFTEEGNKKAIPIVEGEDIPAGGQVIYPIICEGDIIGSVIIMAKDEKENISSTEQKLAGVAATFLGRQMEA
jgi:AbrB family transcriptional regulator (stage V sporulation protein T)